MGTPENSPTELISGDGEFKEADFNSFLKSVEQETGASDYVVIAIIGPQSSGKSTLINHLFFTKFKQMNAAHGRSHATTKGIWVAKAPKIEPLTIAVDLEGTDGREKCEDDQTFERQSALFAVVVADVLIINMWCHDVGREHAANRPLLKAIFEAMMRLFGPHKTTLLFVLRDKTKTPTEILKSDLKEDVEKIWKTAIKPPGHENTCLSETFNVEVAALSNYESTSDIFAEEVAQLRSQFFDSISTRRQNVVPGSEVIPFSSAKIIWDMIKECKDLHLPSHKVMVSAVRCEEFAMEKLRLFASDKDWLLLQEEAATKLVSGFSIRIRSIFDKYLAEYDSECKQYEKDVSKAKREYLISKVSKVIHFLYLEITQSITLLPSKKEEKQGEGKPLSQLVRPAYVNTLGLRRSNALRSFETELKAALSEGGGFSESVRRCQEFSIIQFDDQCDSNDGAFTNDISTVRRELLLDIKNNWLLLRADKLPQIAAQQREGFSAKFGRELRYFLINCDEKDLWGSIRDLVKRESDSAALALPLAVAKFELDPPTLGKLVDDFKQSARELVVTQFKEETKDVLKLLKQRFATTSILINDESEASDEEVKKVAYHECVKFLSTMAVIRLDEGDDDRVESVLLSTLMAPHQISPDPLASHTWEQVPLQMTLITPVRCREIWNRFKQEMEQHYDNTMHVQEKCNEASHSQPPTWVIMGLLALGSFSAFMFLTRVLRMKVKVAMDLIANGIEAVAGEIGQDKVAEAMKSYKNLRKIKVSDFIGFGRKYRSLMKKAMQALKKFYKYMKSLIVKAKSLFAKESAIMVS